MPSDRTQIPVLLRKLPVVEESALNTQEHSRGNSGFTAHSADEIIRFTTNLLDSSLPHSYFTTEGGAKRLPAFVAIAYRANPLGSESVMVRFWRVGTDRYLTKSELVLP
jgi:hypothetical protein